MLIKKIQLHNFRIYRNTTFTFDDSKFILLGGSNGFGKTTLIDAIEWCLTGNIERIKKGFDARNTQQTEKDRVENNNGIIKNFDAGKTEKIVVTLYIEIDNEEVIVRRVQQGDSLYATSDFEILNITDESKKVNLKSKLEIDNYYNYHICDVRKSFEFLSSNRREIKSQFTDFLQSRDSVDNFLDELKSYSNDLKLINADLEGTITPDETLSILKEAINELKEKNIISKYPDDKLYEDEKININELSFEELSLQLKEIKSCAYSLAFEKCNIIIKNNEIKKKLVKAKEVADLYTKENENIEYVLKNKYWDDNELKKINDKINVIDLNLKAVDECKTTKRYKELVGEVDAPKCLAEVNDLIVSSEQFEITIKSLTKDIKEREKGNDVIAALTNLITDRKGLFEYKQEGYDNCPLCGSSENFSNVKELAEIASEAELYVNKLKTDIVDLKEDVKKLRVNLGDNLSKIKELLTIELKNKRDEIVSIFDDYNTYNKKTKLFFEKLNQLNISPKLELQLEINKLIDSNLDEVIPDETIDDHYLILRNILTILDYPIRDDQVDDRNIDKIRLGIQSYRSESLLKQELSYEVLKNKIAGINGLLGSKEIEKKMNELKKFTDKNKSINEYIEKNNEYRSNIEKLIKKINTAKLSLEKMELESVGPYLYKIFTKIIKHSVITEFKFKQDASKINPGVTILDQENNNILNTLSQGQLGVLMISYFLANIFKRREETVFNSYFVDDITSSMDDMNILSLVDIVKYELSNEKSAIKQFFFATCNSDLESLFINKMDSFDIKSTKIRFDSYADGEILIQNREPIIFTRKS